MLRTACIYDQTPKELGERISVMRRHTEDDGKTPDPLIVKGKSFQRWVPELGAPGWLVAWWYNGNEQQGANKLARWKIFESDYRNYLRRNDIKGKVEDLAQEALRRDIVILCKEKLPKFCHRSILADVIRSEVPELLVRHVIPEEGEA